MTTPSTAPGRAATGAAVGLKFEHVAMTFPDGTAAVADATFSVDRGEFVTVVGPSGCGKSTLLRIASGLLEPTGGAITIEAQQRASGQKRPTWPGNAIVGYVFQDPTLMPWRTVQGNVELLSELHGFPRDERRLVAQRAIDLVGLTGFEHHYPKSLSGGMRMRCSLARTLTLQPPIMLFDEPFGAVDEITRERLNEETLRLFDDQRFAGLFITHSISEAVFLSTRVLVMSPRPGRIVAELDVPFPYPRDPDLRFDQRFAAISAEVSHILRTGEDRR